MLVLFANTPKIGPVTSGGCNFVSPPAKLAISSMTSSFNTVPLRPDSTHCEVNTAYSLPYVPAVAGCISWSDSEVQNSCHKSRSVGGEGVKATTHWVVCGVHVSCSPCIAHQSGTALRFDIWNRENDSCCEENSTFFRMTLIDFDCFF
jgi:hypothetical protein